MYVASADNSIRRIQKCDSGNKQGKRPTSRGEGAVRVCCKSKDELTAARRNLVGVPPKAIDVVLTYDFEQKENVCHSRT